MVHPPSRAFFRRKAACAVLWLTAAACTPALSELRKDIPASETQFDIALLDGDPQGRLAAIRRLCHPLATLEQQRLGFGIARRAVQPVGSSETGQADSTKSAAQPPQAPAENLELARCAALIAADANIPQGERAAFLEEGIAAARRAGSDAILTGKCTEAGENGTGEKTLSSQSSAPQTCSAENAQAAYVHAVLAGQKMRLTGMTEALRLLGEEITLLKAAQAVPDEEQGGPLRLLGFIYLKAPAWPAGPGDLDKSLELLSAAVSRYPSHPLNHLFLAAALNEDGDSEAAAAEISRGLQLADEHLWGRQAAQWRDLDSLTEVR